MFKRTVDFGMILALSLFALMPAACERDDTDNDRFPATTTTIAETTTSTTTTTVSVTFEKVKDITVIPDDTFENGGYFSRIFQKNEGGFFVTFQTDQPDPGTDFGYKDYTEDLAETGSSGIFRNAQSCDYAAAFSGDFYYFCSIDMETGFMDLVKYDRDWREVKQVAVELEDNEVGYDQMLALVNNRLILSSFVEPDGVPDANLGGATYHYLYGTDLEFEQKMILDDTMHINGASMTFVDDVYYYVSSTSYFGDIIIMKYDTSWNYLGSQTIMPEGQWPQGVAYEDGLFYVAYLDHTTRPSQNAVLAVFDTDWNLLGNVKITDFLPPDTPDPEEYPQAGRPWVIVKDGKAYVAYDQRVVVEEGPSLNPECHVTVFDIVVNR